ncbi:related to Molybdopterin synthase small subunit [Sporisorium reilianum SRZ2]|uniref:Molybdopterin synthase sulfur carrier subunit n=2 Tax=Sporisorium reilianum TaxID=72558 RepID=E6ZSD1_SPORE|nr:related to Molybdopterin synthase small subunit [Sporisorium reilianum SRZ2]SJX65788.1 related to Molybdopterin synthase small subunit [Sporisorium reilianum f. sp. reilianum]
MSSGSASVRILYFAAARTTIGHSSETLSLPSTPFPLSSLVSLIGDKYVAKGAQAVLRTCRWSVDNTLIEIEDIDEWTLKGGEEVAAIPPVSGG